MARGVETELVEANEKLEMYHLLAFRSAFDEQVVYSLRLKFPVTRNRGSLNALKSCVAYNQDPKYTLLVRRPQYIIFQRLNKVSLEHPGVAPKARKDFMGQLDAQLGIYESTKHGL